jgi:hypothetical protein
MDPRRRAADRDRGGDDEDDDDDNDEEKNAGSYLVEPDWSADIGEDDDEREEEEYDDAGDGGWHQCSPGCGITWGDSCR